MDVFYAIKSLFEEKKRIERQIAVLEARLQVEQGANGTRRRRGRPSMSPDERRQVSERMRRYWEERRKAAEISSIS